MPKKQIVYMHKGSGNIKICRTELQGQLLGKDWAKVEFTKNSKGEPVTRFKFDQFTIDISPAGEREVTPHDGNRNPE